jgi:purine-nucleoside phosphorylase
MRVLGLSCITDMCLADALEPANMDSILAAAAVAAPKLEKIITGVLSEEARSM